MPNTTAVARLEDHLRLLEHRHQDRELSLSHISGAMGTTMGFGPPGAQQVMAFQQQQAFAAKNAEVMGMKQELQALEREIDTFR